MSFIRNVANLTITNINIDNTYLQAQVDIGLIRITVNNSGTLSGIAYISLDNCTEGVTTNPSTQLISLSPQQIEIYIFTMFLSSSIGGLIKCKVLMKDILGRILSGTDQEVGLNY